MGTADDGKGGQRAAQGPYGAPQEPSEAWARFMRLCCGRCPHYC